jgi:hypothetical protein
MLWNRVALPTGFEPVFSKHALVRGRRRLLDRSQGLAVQAWIRSLG